MGRLLREHTHELFKRSPWLAHLKFNLHSVTVQQVRRKRRIMKGVVPVPRAAAFVIVGEDPLEPLDVALFYLFCEFFDVVRIIDVEFISVVAHFPAIYSKLHPVHIRLNQLFLLQTLL